MLTLRASAAGEDKQENEYLRGMFSKDSTDNRCYGQQTLCTDVGPGHSTIIFNPYSSAGDMKAAMDAQRAPQIAGGGSQVSAMSLAMANATMSFNYFIGDVETAGVNLQIGSAITFQSIGIGIGINSGFDDIYRQQRRENAAVLLGVANQLLNPFAGIYDCVTKGGCGVAGWGLAAATVIPMPMGKLTGAVARSLEELSGAAGVLDRNGLTAAGRALQKHGDRTGSAFTQVPGGPRALNPAGQDVVDDILTSPGSTVSPNRLGGVDVRAPDGRGIRYNGDGSFRGFLEP
jgi:hypothetical protein